MTDAGGGGEVEAEADPFRFCCGGGGGINNRCNLFSGTNNVCRGGLRPKIEFIFVLSTACCDAVVLFLCPNGVLSIWFLLRWRNNDSIRVAVRFPLRGMIRLRWAIQTSRHFSWRWKSIRLSTSTAVLPILLLLLLSSSTLPVPARIPFAFGWNIPTTISSVGSRVFASRQIICNKSFPLLLLLLIVELLLLLLLLLSRRILFNLVSLATRCRPT